MILTSNHQTTNLVFPKFFHKCFSVLSSWRREQAFHWYKNEKKPFCTNKKFFLFQLLKLRKMYGNNWGKQNWWFDVMNKILECRRIFFFLGWFWPPRRLEESKTWLIPCSPEYFQTAMAATADKLSWLNTYAQSRNKKL